MKIGGFKMEDNMNYNEELNNVVDSKMQSDNAPSFFDCLFRLAADEATIELIKKGVQTIKDIKQSASKTFNAVIDEEYAKMCMSIVTMDDCITWVKIQKQKYLEGQYFFVYVEKTLKPRNENDKLSVTIALLDAYKKTIPVEKAQKRLFGSGNKNDDIVSLVVPTATIDTKLVKALNGTSSVLVKL